MTTPGELPTEASIDRPNNSPSNNDKPGGTGKTTARQLMALLLAALGVWALVSLREWHETFAASEDWARAIRDKQLEGSELLAAASRETRGRFPTEAGLKTALFARIGDSDSAAVTRAGGEELVNYRLLVRRRGAVNDALRAQTTDADKRIQTRLRDLSTDIESTQGKAAAETPEKLAERRAATQRELGALNQQRQATVSVLKQMLADLDGQIDAVQAGWQKVFDVALPAARPVDRFPARLWPWLAIRMGDEASPWHLFYVLLWYAIEGLAALMLCIAVVPWILRLAGGNATAGEVGTKLKDVLASLFKGGSPPRVAGGIVKAIAAVAMGTLAVNGVGLAAGNVSPPIAPVVLHDPERGFVGPKGAPGESGKEGDPGRPGPAGSPGKDGSTAREGDLTVVFIDGADLRPELKDLSRQVAASGDATRVVVVGKSSQILGAVQSTGQAVGGVRNAVDTLHTFERASWEQEIAANGQLTVAVQQLDDKTDHVKVDVAAVREAMAPAAKNVSVAAADVLRTNAKPGGVVANLNPRNRYRVNDAVIATIERALLASGSDAAGAAVLDALRAEKAGRTQPQRIGQFQFDLNNANGIRGSAEARDLLREVMPLILKVSRVPR